MKGKKKIKSKTGKINPKMNFAEILQRYPETAEVFSKHNMHCFGCPAAMMETLEAGIRAHRLDVKKVLAELNKAVKKKEKI